MARRRFFLIQVLIFYATTSSGIRPQCRNEEGKPIDWYYVYKLPKDENHANPLIQKGLAYLYLTPSNVRSGWELSNFSIGDPLSIVGKTLEPMYQQNSFISLLYNDQPPLLKNRPNLMEPMAGLYSMNLRVLKPIKTMSKKLLNDKHDRFETCKIDIKNKTLTSNGHTKGVIFGDRNSSIWLVHSVPRFPPIPFGNELYLNLYNYPTTGTKYGQTFLCTSLRTKTLNDIGVLLKYNQPLITYSHVPEELYDVVPVLVEVIENKTVIRPPWHHTQCFTTIKGKRFIVFAKSGCFHDDMYSALVTQTLRSDLLVQAWATGAGASESDCRNSFKVRNIERINVPVANMTFTSDHDRSKWAVSALLEEERLDHNDTYIGAWTCVGDVNREDPTEYRGGSTVCISDSMIWENFSRLIISAQNNCTNNSHKSDHIIPLDDDFLW